MAIVKRIGLIGLGRMGKIHLRHVMQQVPGAAIVAVSDAVSNQDDFRKEYGDIFFTKHAEELIGRADVDAVIICTPTSTHASLVEKALSNNKAVFCEKPLDLSLEITETLLAKAKSLDVPLMIGFNRRFDPDFMEIKKSIIAGKIGNPQIIKITNRDPGLPSIDFVKTSGGMFMDFTIHDFDMIRFLMDKEVTEIFAKGMVFFDEAIGEAGDIDTSLTTVTFADGTYALIDNSRKAVYGYDQRLEVFGSEGMLKVENNVHDTNILFNETGIHSALPLHSFTERYDRSYLKEIELFIDALVNDNEMPVKRKDIIMATAMAYAANKSMQEKRPVKLSEIARREDLS
jgi:myo-inositol 2-dehydrogenase/D-chiro-inositol 1-dehydrogenase